MHNRADFSGVVGGSSTTAPAKKGVLETLRRINRDAAKPLNELMRATERSADRFRQQTGLEHGVTGVGAKLLGVPRWLLIAGLAGVAYLAVQSYLPTRRR